MEDRYCYILQRNRRVNHYRFFFASFLVFEFVKFLSLLHNDAAHLRNTLTLKVDT